MHCIVESFVLPNVHDPLNFGPPLGMKRNLSFETATRTALGFLSPQIVIENLLETLPPVFPVLRLLVEAQLLHFLVIAEIPGWKSWRNQLKCLPSYLGNTNWCFDVVTGLQDLQSTVNVLEVSSKSNLNQGIHYLLKRHLKKAFSGPEDLLIILSYNIFSVVLPFSLY